MGEGEHGLGLLRTCGRGVGHTALCPSHINHIPTPPISPHFFPS